MRKYTVVLVAALALLGVASAMLNLPPVLKASEPQAQPLAITDAQQPAAVSVKHTALNSVIDYGQGGGTLGPVHTTIDTTNIVCPSTATKGCTVGFESMVQVGGNTSSTKTRGPFVIRWTTFSRNRRARFKAVSLAMGAT